MGQDRVAAILRCMVLTLALAPLCNGQAWAPLRGQGAVSVSYQTINNKGHRLTDGTLIPGGQSLNMAAFVEVDYALTNRLFLTLGLPYVFSKFTDQNPPPPPFPYLPWDQCRCWQSGWQVAL